MRKEKTREEEGVGKKGRENGAAVSP